METDNRPKIDKATVAQPRLAEEDFEVDGVGWVRIRALSRSQALRLEDNPSAREKDAQILAWGIVDPLFTVAEINQWLDNSAAGELEPLSKRIAVISKMLEDAPKAAYKSNGRRPRS